MYTTYGGLEKPHKSGTHLKKSFQMQRGIQHPAIGHRFIAKSVGLRRRTGKAVPGKAVPGKAVPGKAVPGKAVPGKAVPGIWVLGYPTKTVVTRFHFSVPITRKRLLNILTEHVSHTNGSLWFFVNFLVWDATSRS